MDAASPRLDKAWAVIATATIVASTLLLQHVASGTRLSIPIPIDERSDKCPTFTTVPSAPRRKEPTCPKSRADKDSSMWRSQLGQDAWVAAATGYKRSGFFVELGAGDGLYLSNTASLEEHLGWTGICIEPVPRQYGELIRNRRCACDNSCVGVRDGDQVSFVVDQKYDEHHHFSGIVNTLNGYTPQGEELRMVTRSLASVLREKGAPRVMDYLSLDTEGSEFAILSSFPFGEYAFRLMTIEHNFQVQQRAQIKYLLERHGYVLVEERQWDDFYAHPALI